MASNDTSSSFSGRSNEFGTSYLAYPDNKVGSDGHLLDPSACRRSLSDTTAASSIDIGHNEHSQRKRAKTTSHPPTLNDEYSMRLAGLHEIRDILQSKCDSLRLPQIIVVGSQSDGKSSLLSCLTGVEFPEKSGICTKAPIVVRCKYDAERNCDQYSVRDPMDNRYVECRKAEVANRVSDIQESVLHGRDRIVSEDEISVLVAGPNQIEIIIIDLPGIITNGEGQEETKGLIRKYGRHEETLILLVTKAETDSQLLPALDLAKEINPSGDRTLRVLTKFDQFGSPDVKNRALELMHSGNGSALEPHAAICRSNCAGNMVYDEEREMQILQECNLPPRLTGVSALKLRLPPLFSRLVDNNLPKLWEQASSIKEAATLRLDTIGWKPADPKEKVCACRDKLMGQSEIYFQERISVVFQTFRKEIRETEDRVTQEFTDANYKENIFSVRSLYGENAVNTSLRQIVDWWTPITDKYISAVEDILSQELQPLEKGDLKSFRPLECGSIGFIPRSLLNFLRTRWRAYYRGFCSTFRENCGLALNKEKLPGTMSPVPFPFDSDSEKLRQKMSPIDEQKFLIFTEVKGLFMRETETFIDSIMKETRYTILVGRHSFPDTELTHLLPEIREKAIDSYDVLLERKRLKDEIHRMDRVEEKLKSIGFAA